MNGPRAGLGAAAAALVAFASGAVSAAPSLSFGGDLAVIHDSNAGNSQTDEDLRDTSRIAAGVGATYAHRFGPLLTLQLRGALDTEQDLDLDQLSFVRAGVRVRALHKPGAGFFVPVIAVWAGAGVRDYGSAIRDGNDSRGGVYLAQPLTTRLSARLETVIAERKADGRAFDLEETSYAASLDWIAAPWLTLYGEYRVADGGIVISAFGGGITPKTQHQYLAQYADAIEPDDAFGPDWNAFRVEGDTQIVTLGGNVPLRGGLALDAQLQSASAEAYGYSYDRWLASVSLLMRF